MTALWSLYAYGISWVLPYFAPFSPTGDPYLLICDLILVAVWLRDNGIQGPSPLPGSLTGKENDRKKQEAKQEKRKK